MTGSGLSPAQRLVLECCATPDRNFSEQLAALDRNSAVQLVELALQTRTAALLHRATDGSDGAVRDQLALLAKQYTLHNLRTGQVLLEVFDLLASEGLRPIALKGAWLAFEAYPAPQLRPLRDIDLLLKPDAAEIAQAFLLSLPDFELARKAGRYGLEHSHQLPEVVHMPSGVFLEIHHRVNARGWGHEQELLHMIFGEARDLAIFGGEIRIPSPTANFLHLLEHATLHHAFANGPLILSDIHYLAKNQSLDFASIDKHVDGLGLRKASNLLAGVARNLGAEWPAGAVKGAATTRLVDSALAAILMTEEQIAQHDQARRLERMGGNFVGRILRSLRPDPFELAKHSGRSVDSVANWLGYPSWLLEKGSRFWRGHRNRMAIEQFGARDQIIDWLQQ